MSGYFYAIGGANYEKNESLIIDLDIINESKKAKPNVLFIPAANNDEISKIEVFVNYYTKLNTNVEVLYSNSSSLNCDIIKMKVEKADIIYLAGGITSRLYDFLMKYNLQEILKNAYESGKIIVGVSAGAIVFFDYGFGDKEAYVFNLETVNHRFTKGLGILSGVFCPHYQNNGLLSFHDEIKHFKLDGYALENGAALKINNEGFVVVKNKGSNAFKFDFNDNHKLVYLNQNCIYNETLIK